MEQHEQLITRAATYRGVAATRVEGASPGALVVILLDELVDWLVVMGGAIVIGCDRRRDEAQERAEAVLFALASSLDGETGSLGKRMAQIYAEVHKLMLSARAENDPDRCNKARALIEPICEAWRDIA